MELPREVLMSIDPIVDMAGFATIKGASLRELATARRTDREFPEPLGELPSRGPVFAYGAVRDYLDGDGTYGGDAQLRRELAQSAAQDEPGSHNANINNVLIAARYQEVPPIGEDRNPAFITPVWEEQDPDDPLAGGKWVAAVFRDHDEVDPDGEPVETYEVLTDLQLIDLMERADWKVWLHEHIQNQDEIVKAASSVLEALTQPVIADSIRERAATAARTLERMNTELAHGAYQRTLEPGCPNKMLATVLASSTVTVDLLNQLRQPRPTG